MQAILGFNLAASTAVFYMAARIYLLPRLGQLERRSVLLPILLLHSLRHLGLMFLARGAVLPGMPPQFAYPVALGDLLAAALAFFAIFPVAARSKGASAWVWLFNVEGSVDLISAITLANVYRAAPYMGAAYWIPGFWVPALLVSHYVVFIVLRMPEKGGGIHGQA